MTRPAITVIGDRINPGFKRVRAMVEANDIEGIQALAVKQREAGAAYLDFTLGPRAKEDPKFTIDVVQAVQDAVDTPLCFDDPDPEVQALYLKHYDQGKANGAIPMINSISETRWEIAELLTIRPVKLILMANERIEDGVRKQNKTAGERVSTVKRMTERLLAGGYGFSIDDLIVDIAISALSADREGLTRHCLDAISTIHDDPDLEGIHMSGGLTNLAAQLPTREIDGKPFRLQLENSFLTLAVPLGFDMVLATPWRDFEILPEDNTVLQAFKEIIALDGLDALRRLRKLYTG